MAGKGGGGAWKVAYADFVTAMMAFFLVMWIVGQDQQVRRSVSDYFSDPMGAPSSDSPKKPSRTGALADYMSTGFVPLEEKVAMGSGRRAHSQLQNASPATKLVNDWISNNEDVSKYWKKQAQDHRESARWNKEVRSDKKTIEDVAIRKLTIQMREEFERDIPQKADGVYRELLRKVLGNVNWTELAQDMMER